MDGDLSQQIYGWCVVLYLCLWNDCINKTNIYLLIYCSPQAIIMLYHWPHCSQFYWIWKWWLLNNHTYPMFTFMELLTSLSPFFTTAAVIVLSPIVKERIPEDVRNFLFSIYEKTQSHHWRELWYGSQSNLWRCHNLPTYHY